MGDDQGVIRVNVSVPRELKARMDAVAQRVNWSQTAAEAFEAKLLELAAQQEAKQMDDVIARMKAAAELDDKEEYQAGREEGESWAREVARPRQLRRLEELADDPQHGLAGRLGIFANGMNRGIAWGLYQAITGSQDVDHHEVNAFWEQAISEANHLDGSASRRIEDEGFALGFCEGALEVWKAVKDEL
jgi:hypothetical protein